MQRLLLAALLLLDVLTGALALSQCSPTKLPKGKYSRSTVDDEFLDQLDHFFPPSGAGTVCNSNNKFLYKAPSMADLEVLFLRAGSAKPNTIGYYIYNSTTNKAERETVLFPDVNCAGVGDTINIGSFLWGTRIGFYLIAPQNSTSTHKFWSYEPQNSPNPDNLPHVYFAYIDQEFVIGFEDMYGGGEKDFRDVILMIRPAYIKPPPVGEGSVECYEAANLIIGVATLFLGFAASAIQTLWDKPDSREQLFFATLASFAFAIALGLSFDYRVRAASDVTKISCDKTIISAVATVAGIFLMFPTALMSLECFRKIGANFKAKEN